MLCLFRSRDSYCHFFSAGPRSTKFVMCQKEKSVFLSQYRAGWLSIRGELRSTILFFAHFSYFLLSFPAVGRKRERIGVLFS